MTKKRPEIMREICQSIADGVKPLDATLLAGLSERAFFLWLRQSKENAADPALTVDWLGEPVPFASAVSAARDIAASGGRSAPSANVVHHYHHFIFETASPPVADETPRPECRLRARHSKAEPVPGEDAELDEMLRLEPLPDATSSETLHPEPYAASSETAHPELIPDEAAPAPLAFDEPPARPPRSALERDLLARLAAARAKNAPATAQGSGEPDGGSADSAMAPGGVSTD